MQRSVQVVLTLVVLQAVQISGGQNYSKCNSNSGDTERQMVSPIDPEALSCPASFSEDDEKRYCCRVNNTMEVLFECCDASAFLEQTSVYALLPTLVFLIVLALMIRFICVSCPCCLFYKRKNDGAVYNTVPQQQQQNAVAQPVAQQGPNRSVNQQQQHPPYPQQQQHPPYPQQQQQPPPYPMPQYGYQPAPSYPMMPLPQQNYPMMSPQDAYPPACPSPAAPYPPAGPPPAQPMPPPYTDNKDQMYNRQAPFNPNF